MPKAKAQVIQIQATIVWFAHRDPDSGMWIGVCPTLNLNALGETWADLQDCANQAMALLFAERLAAGEFDAFVKHQNWQVRYGVSRTGSEPRFDIPTEWKERSRFADLAVTHA